MSAPAPGQAGHGRVEASASKVIGASATDVWQLVSDWEGFPMRINMAGVTHVDGGDGNNPLRTRRMTFENGAVVTEILLHKDDDTRRLYGRTLDDNPLPWRNYLATLFVDEVDSAHCRVTVNGWCDALEPAGAADIRAFIAQSWTDGIIDGLERTLANT